MTYRLYSAGAFHQNIFQWWCPCGVLTIAVDREQWDREQRSQPPTPLLPTTGLRPSLATAQETAGKKTLSPHEQQSHRATNST